VTNISPIQRIAVISLDCVFLAALWFAVAFALFIIAFASDVHPIFWCPLMIVPILYFGTEVVRDASTAKYIFKLHILCVNGSPLSVRRRASRWILKTFPFFFSFGCLIPKEPWFSASLIIFLATAIVSLALNLIMLLIKKMTLIDLIVGSVVMGLDPTAIPTRAFPVLPAE
jgi:hypothetical protein